MRAQALLQKNSKPTMKRLSAELQPNQRTRGTNMRILARGYPRRKVMGDTRRSLAGQPWEPHHESPRNSRSPPGACRRRASCVSFSLTGAFAYKDQAAPPRRRKPRKPRRQRPPISVLDKDRCRRFHHVFTGKAERGQGFKTALQRSRRGACTLPLPSLKVVTADTGITAKRGLHLGKLIRCRTAHSAPESGAQVRGLCCRSRKRLDVPAEKSADRRRGRDFAERTASELSECRGESAPCAGEASRC